MFEPVDGALLTCGSGSAIAERLDVGRVTRVDVHFVTFRDVRRSVGKLKYYKNFCRNVRWQESQDSIKSKRQYDYEYDYEFLHSVSLALSSRPNCKVCIKCHCFGMYSLSLF